MIDDNTGVRLLDMTRWSCSSRRRAQTMVLNHSHDDVLTQISYVFLQKRPLWLLLVSIPCDDIEARPHSSQTLFG